MTTPDREVARRAALQHGYVHRDQLVDAGMDANAIAYRVRVGRLHQRYREVYAVGHVPPSPHARAMAAVLACGPGAVLSHWSAGALWGIVVRWALIVDVTAGSKHRLKGIRVHRSRTLSAHDVTTHFGIPATTPARTLLDLAPHLDSPSLTRAVNEAQLRHKSTLPDLADLLTRNPGRETTRLRPFVQHASGPTRSRFEDEFLRFVKRYHLPTPETNQVVAGFEVDVLWRRERLTVELDGREFHEARFEEDRDRDATLLSAGFSVVRITWKRLTEESDREASRLRAALAARAAAQ